MPPRVPTCTLPRLPDFPALTNLKDAVRQWSRELEEWRKQTQDALARNWLQFERFSTSVTVLSSSTVALSSSTAGSTIPGLSATVNVPMGAVVNVTAFLDLRSDVAAVAAIGELYSKGPGTTIFTINSQTTKQAVLVPLSAGNDLRVTCGQVWRLQQIPAGEWVFEIRARKSTAAGAGSSAAVEDHCSMRVDVV